MIKDSGDRTKFSSGAVRLRASRLKLGPVLMGGDYVTLSQLIRVFTGCHDFSSKEKRKSWIERRGLPVHRKKVINCSFRVVYLKDFWQWAESNRSFLDFSKLEPLALGEEPEWVDEQRKKDFGSIPLHRKNRWTPEDDSRLIMLLKQHKYGYAELSEMMNRSAGSIQRRCVDLGLKERPVRVPTVAQGIHMSGRKRKVKKDLEKLCEILRRMAEREQTDI